MTSIPSQGIEPPTDPERFIRHRTEMTVRFAIWDQGAGAAGRPAAA
ncbi:MULTISPECIES: hypothetical protein [Streptomyces]|nr:hypothetical protein [Streptomyces prasinus]